MFLFQVSLLLLLISLTSSATTSAPTPAIPLVPELFTREMVEGYRFEGYQFLLCGDLADPAEKANKLLVFLYSMKAELERLIEDARLGTRSKHGFAEFFKSDHNIRQVIARYQNIVEGGPVIVSEARAAVHGDRTPQPVLICVNEGDSRTASALAQCKARPTEIVLIEPGVEWVMLCPQFFDDAPVRDAAQPCPKVQPDGKFKQGDRALISGRYADVVHMLVRFYDRAATHNIQGAQSMQEAVELSARNSLRSAVAYGYYAGGKLRRLSSWSCDILTLLSALLGNCTDFPKSKGRLDEGLRRRWN